MLVKAFTDKSVSDAVAALQAAVQANHFGVMQVHNLKETTAKKGAEFARKCLIFEVCQPQQVKNVLDQNMSVSTALPRRISIYEGNGKAILATLKPTSGIRLIASCLTVKQTPGRSHNAHSPIHSEVDKAGQSPTCGRLLTKGPQQDGAGLGCLLGE